MVQSAPTCTSPARRPKPWAARERTCIAAHVSRVGDMYDSYIVLYFASLILVEIALCDDAATRLKPGFPQTVQQSAWFIASGRGVAMHR